MLDVCELTKFTANGKALRLVIEHLKDAQRLRRIGPDKGGRWSVCASLP